MKITVLGAAGGEVTGSAYLVETARARVLVDCGLFQGGHRAEELNRPPLGAGVPPPDAVVLTHAHLDHTGRLPLLASTGFAGPIFATPATIDLTGLILRDAARIQAQDADRHNRHRRRAGEERVEEDLLVVGEAVPGFRHEKWPKEGAESEKPLAESGKQ